MYHYFVCQCERKNVTNYNIKTLLTLGLIDFRDVKCEKDVHLGIDEIQYIDSGCLHFAKKLTSPGSLCP